MAGRVGLENTDMRDDQFGGPLYEEVDPDMDYDTGKGAPLVPEVLEYKEGFDIEDTVYETPEEMAEEIDKPLAAVTAALNGEERAIEYITEEQTPEVAQTSSLTYTRDKVLI